MSQRSEPDKSEPYDEPAYPKSVFGPQHNLTPEQVFNADRCLRRAWAKRGAVKGFRYLRRLGGITSAAKAGRIGNVGPPHGGEARRPGHGREAPFICSARWRHMLGGDPSRRDNYGSAETPTSRTKHVGRRAVPDAGRPLS